MAEKHLKKCSTYFVIREMQIKTTLIFHLTPVRMTKIKNSGDSTCWWWCGERGTLFHCWWVCKLVQPLWKFAWCFHRKLDLRTQLYHSWTYTQKMLYPTIRTLALFIIARSWKEPRCPSTEEWIQKVWYIYTMEYYTAIKNNEFMKFFCKWMDGTRKYPDCGNLVTKEHAWYAFTYKWILAAK